MTTPLEQLKKSILQNSGCFLLLVIGLWTIPLATSLPGSGLDPSWRIGINLALLNKLPFGTGVIFPYGVLGFLGQPLALDYSLWSMSLIFAVFTHFLLIVALCLLLNNFSARWYHYLLFIPILIFTLPLPSYWGLLLAVSLFLFQILIRDEYSRPVSLCLVACGFLLAVDSLIKFDMLINSLYLMGVFCSISFIKKRELKQTAILSGSYLISFIGIWFLAGQYIPLIFTFMVGGIEVAKGYTEAMAITGPIWQVYIGLLSLLLILASTLHFAEVNNKKGLLFIILNAAILFSAFKSGFVRHDGHILIFFQIFILAFGILLMCEMNALKNAGYQRFIRAMLLIVTTVMMGILMVSVCIVTPWALQDNALVQAPVNELSLHLLSNQTYFEKLTSRQQETIRSEYPLNDLLKRIDNQSIDVFPWDIALCWAYDLNWDPRPVFQSYSAYTPYLDKVNSNHFHGSSSPDLILFTYISLDRRYPLFEEPETFRTILNTYSYEGESGNFILLNRSSNPAGYKTVDIGSVTARMGDPVKVPSFDGEIFGNISVKYSIQGNFLKIVYKPAQLFITFRQKNGMVSPRYRFIPTTASDGVFLSQYVGDTDTAAWIFQGNRINDIDSVTIETDRPSDYAEFITIDYSGIQIAGKNNDSLLTTHPVLFKDVVFEIGSPSYSIKNINGERKIAVLEHSKKDGSSIQIHNILIANRSVLRFSIALDPRTWSPRKGDGVEYRIYVNTSQRDDLVFKRYIDPKKNSNERRWNENEVNLSEYAGQNITLTLSTLPGPHDDNSWDWAWWGDLQILSE